MGNKDRIRRHCNLEPIFKVKVLWFPWFVFCMQIFWKLFDIDYIWKKSGPPQNKKRTRPRLLQFTVHINISYYYFWRKCDENELSIGTFIFFNFSVQDKPYLTYQLCFRLLSVIYNKLRTVHLLTVNHFHRPKESVDWRARLSSSLPGRSSQSPQRRLYSVPMTHGPAKRQNRSAIVLCFGNFFLSSLFAFEL